MVQRFSGSRGWTERSLLQVLRILDDGASLLIITRKRPPFCYHMGGYHSEHCQAHGKADARWHMFPLEGRSARVFTHFAELLSLCIHCRGRLQGLQDFPPPGELPGHFIRRARATMEKGDGKGGAPMPGRCSCSFFSAGRISGLIHLGLHLPVTPVLDQVGFDLDDDIVGIIEPLEHGGVVFLPERLLDLRRVEYGRSTGNLHISL